MLKALAVQGVHISTSAVYHLTPTQLTERWILFSGVQSSSGCLLPDALKG